MRVRSVAAIILGAGQGSRLREMAPPYSKTILTICDLPIIGYAVQAVEAYVDRIVLVAHPSTAEVVYEAMVASLRCETLETRVVVQNEPLGMADAMRIGFSALEGDQTAVVMAGDNIVLDDCNVRNVLALVDDQSSSASPCRLAWTHRELPPEEARRFSVYQDLGEGKGQLLEKPQEPPSKICWCGPVAFRSSQEALRRMKNLKPSSRGEYEATDLMNTYNMIGEAKHVELEGQWFDIGTPKAFEEAQAIIGAEKRPKTGKMVV
ncbi:MAG: hypothetical protein CSB13_02725 [Chloroflexi bacterium]|nr:MAG: hypothetical protein CSB13_02725 [Chloroflexota bacterium]